MKTRFLAVLTLIASLVVALFVVPSGAVAEPAAKPKKILEGYTCGGMDWDDGGSGVYVSVNAGHWTNKQGKITRPCGYDHHKWHPTIPAFTATIRYFAGTKVIKKQTKVINNRTQPPWMHFSFYDGGYGSSGPFFNDGPGDRVTYGGKPFKVTVTMTRKGFKPKVITRWNFPYDG